MLKKFASILLSNNDFVKSCRIRQTLIFYTNKEVWFVTDSLTVENLIRFNSFVFSTLRKLDLDFTSLLISENEILECSHQEYDIGVFI